MNVSFVKWVTVARATELTGYSVASIQHKIQSGPWAEGLQWKWADDNSQMFFKTYSKWLDSDDDWREVEKLSVTNLVIKARKPA